LMVDIEWSRRKSNKLALLIKRAEFRFSQACIEDVNVNEKVYHLITNLFTTHDHEKVYHFRDYEHELVYH